ncbi:hypothetical protein OXT66_07745 [Lentilactobacillus senioris]|uniref:hypothetical protein n=1 Tax=Lentilactobacillus senioris TaxID=931534 RepID=UPI00227F13CF|nr:hypothetical protein [Lentilactobacillus senioris]MCY9807424.1 hypothetical protein [Lentilactobacillus senioris]
MPKHFRTTIWLALLLGIMVTGLFSHPAQASRHYTVTPVALRGKWATTKNANGISKYINITKYTFYGADYKNGKKQPNSIYASGKKFIANTNFTNLALSKHKNKFGYWNIGMSQSIATWKLKPVTVKHNGKKVKALSAVFIEDYNAYQMKFIHRYYYQK